jgi:uncharacterized ion transporter superfamily protein YfcC
MSTSNLKEQIKNEENLQTKKTWRMPDTYVIIFGVVLFAALLTYLIPVGQFETEKVTYMYNGTEKTRTVPIPESFVILQDENGQDVKNGIKVFEPFGGVGITNYAFEGLVSGSKWGSAVGVVAFILVIGGAFGIVLKTGAVEAGIMSMIRKTKGAESAIIPILFVLFSLGGAIFGMGEEAIPFAMILVPILIAMGYDSITGIMVVYTATQIGFATSWMNPFGVAIAQGVSGIPVMSGSGYRMALWLFFTSLGIAFTWNYARKVKKNPTSSLAYESDAYFRNDFSSADNMSRIEFKTGHKLILLTILTGLFWVIYGVVKFEYYLPEIATQFFIMGVLSGIIGVIFKLNDMNINTIAESFRDGAKDLLGAALVVGMAKGIVLVLGGSDPTTPTILNTILNSVGGAIGTLPTVVSAWFMYVFQSVFNFFVVSGSGQAAMTMPLMAPLADIVGVTRQVAVLAFQLGDGFTNLIVPTSGCLMGMLAVARLDWSKWAKFQLKFQTVLFTLSSAAIVIAVMIGYN